MRPEPRPYFNFSDGNPLSGGKGGNNNPVHQRNKKKEPPMNWLSENKTGSKDMIINEWFLTHKEELIECPYQNGNLKITRSSCRKLRQQAYYLVPQINHNSFFEYSREKSLLLCKQCDQVFLPENAMGSENPVSLRSLRPRRGYRGRSSNPEGIHPEGGSRAGILLEILTASGPGQPHRGGKPPSLQGVPSWRTPTCIRSPNPRGT